MFDEAAQFGDGVVRDDAEDAGVAAGGQVRGRDRVRDDEGRRRQAALPAARARVASADGLRVEPRRHQHRPRPPQEPRPTRDHRHERVTRRQFLPLHGPLHRARVDEQAGRIRRERRPRALALLAVQRDRQPARQRPAVAARLGTHARDAEARRLPDLPDENRAQPLVRLDDDEVVRRLKLQQALEARLDFSQRVAALARRLQEGGDELVQFEAGARRPLAVLVAANVDAAPAPQLDPAAADQVAVGRADRVRVNPEPPRQLARARQPLARLQVAAHDAEHDLRHELLAHGDFAVFREPDSHQPRDILLFG